MALSNPRFSLPGQNYADSARNFDIKPTSFLRYRVGAICGVTFGPHSAFARFSTAGKAQRPDALLLGASDILGANLKKLFTIRWSCAAEIGINSDCVGK